MKDYFTFKKMITPTIIQIIFWIGVGIIVILSLIGMFGVSNNRFAPSYLSFQSFLTLVFGPIIWRIWCELIIVLFKIYESLNSINHSLQREKNSESPTDDVGT